MPVALVPIALVTAIAGLFTSVTNVGVGIHTAVQSSRAHDLAYQNHRDILRFADRNFVNWHGVGAKKKRDVSDKISDLLTRRFYRHPDDLDGDGELEGEDCIQLLKERHPYDWREVMRTIGDPVHFCHNHYNGGDRKKRGLSDTPPPMVNFTITPLNVNGTTNSSSLPIVINSTGTSATIELIVTSGEEEEADNDSTGDTAQKLFVVSCCEKMEGDDIDTTPMIDLFLLPSVEEDEEEDYEVIDVYVMPALTTRKEKEEDVNYEDHVIRASASKSSYDTYSPVPPPCLPTEITQLCSSVCDHPGATALVLAMLAVLVVVELVLVCYLGSLVRGAINRCYKKYKGGGEEEEEETREEEGKRSSYNNMAMSDSDSYSLEYCKPIPA